MDYIYILITVDVDSYNGRGYDTGYYRTEQAALDAVRLTEDEREKYKRSPSNYPPDNPRQTLHDFGYFQVDRVELLG